MAIYHSYRIPDFRIPIMRMPVVAAICSIPYLAMFGLQGEALVQCWWAANVIATTLNVRNIRPGRIGGGMFRVHVGR